MPITLLDGLLIFIVLGSALLAMMRGFIREVLSIGSWIAAAAGTYYLYPVVFEQTQNYVSEEIFAKAIAIGGTFLVILMIVSYITMRISDFVIDSKIGPLDRTLGFVFGGARGLLIFVIGMLFFNFFAQNNQPDWVTNAKSKPMLDKLGADLLAALPEDPEKEVLERIKNVTQGIPQRTNDTNQNEDKNQNYLDEQRKELERLIENNQP